MEMSNQEVVFVLNHLVRTCRDGEQGYRDAAEKLDDSELKTQFNAAAQERASFRAELEELVRASGGDPNESGSPDGIVHRAWMNLKASLSGGDDAILKEVVRGENEAVDNYESALKHDLPGPIQETVKRQHDAIMQVRNRYSARVDNDR